uniref:Uncharacterized protein n=1 Tax=Lepisosteus oculatus TaxID=7918 RepID=W5MER2_LEPOC
MEGVLHKWTNYLSGDSLLIILTSFVGSFGQKHLCKRSIAVRLFQMSAHSNFSCNKVIVNGELLFVFLFSVNITYNGHPLHGGFDRVIFPSAKACLADSRTKKEKELNEASQSLKGKMSELRLYCDLLMEQVHKIEHSVQPGEGGTLPDTQTMTDASSLLKETCNQFVGVLEDCMRISSKHMAPELCHLSPPDSPAMMVCPSQHHSRRVKRSVSHTGVITPD